MPSRNAHYRNAAACSCAAFELKHHSLDVPVILVPMQELQAFLRIAPLQNLDGFLASAPRIHFTLIRHV